MSKKFIVDADLGWSLSLLGVVMACLPLVGFAFGGKVMEPVTPTEAVTEPEAEAESAPASVPVPVSEPEPEPEPESVQDLVRKIREEKKRMGLE